MKLFRPALALWLASAMFAQQMPVPAPAPDPVPVRAETFNWQAPPDQATAQKSQKAAKKGSGKTKWIVIAAVAGAAVVGVAVVNKRLGNEGKGLF